MRYSDNLYLSVRVTSEQRKGKVKRQGEWAPEMKDAFKKYKEARYAQEA